MKAEAVKARSVHILKRAKLFRGASNDDLLRQQIAWAKPIGDPNRNPREHLHLDTTKLALHSERVDAWRRGEPVAPITIDMALTQKCSFSCTFCYNGLQLLPSAPVDWERYELFLHDCAEMGVKAISLVSDGESTENPDFLRFIVLAKSLGIDVASGTNGYKLTDFDTLVETLTYIRININAADPARNASIMGTSEKIHAKVIDNIKALVEAKRRTGAACTIGLQQVLMPEYADEVLPLAILGRDLGVDYFVVKHCTDNEDGSLGVDYAWYKSEIAQDLFRAAEALSTDRYSVQAKWLKFKTGRDRTYSKCFGTPLLLQMSGTGIVAPCGSFFSERYSSFHIGDIKTERFRDIVDSDRYRSVMARLHSPEFDPRRDCATLCLQDKVNEALYGWIEKGEAIRPTIDNAHRNFI